MAPEPKRLDEDMNTLVGKHFLSKRFPDVERNILYLFVVSLVVISKICCKFVFDLGIMAGTLKRAGNILREFERKWIGISTCL